MAYVCDLGTGQRVFLDNQATLTVVTVASAQAGQQQQASRSFQTGAWTASPQAFQTASGVLIKVQTAQGEQSIQIQGGSINVGMAAASELAQVPMQQIDRVPDLPPITPLAPMQPMQMGNMSMSLNPMEMRMGNMELRMDAAQPSAPKFCNQCGRSVKPDDRFCASCGSQLSSA